MDREKRADAELQQEDYSVKSSRKANVISYIICVLAAIAIWLVIMNVNEPVNIPLGVSASENMTALLSAIVRS